MKQSSQQVLQSISELFELSLSIGSSLDFSENALAFVKKLMARKNLSYCAIWAGQEVLFLQKGSADGESSDGCVKVFGHPSADESRGQQALHNQSQWLDLLQSKGAVSFMMEDVPEGFAFLKDSLNEAGAIALIWIEELSGFIELRSISRSAPFSNFDVNQMRSVMGKFGQSVLASWAHERAIHEIEIRKQAELAAEQANRTKGLFLANIGHELRTPLNAVLGNTQLLKMDGELVERHAETLETIEDSGTHLLDMIGDLLEMSKVESGNVVANFQTVDLGVTVGNVVQSMSPRAEAKGLSMSHETGSEVPKLVTTDRSLLRQILHQLVGNAVKFTNEGEIKVTVRGLSSHEIAIDVSDTGIGLDESQIGELFQPFSRGLMERHTYEGNGIGLSICDRFVRMIGAKIEIESQLGKGATFRLRLPVSTGFESTGSESTDVESSNADDGVEAFAPSSPWKQALAQATQDLDFTAVESLLSEVRHDFPKHYERFVTLAEDFRYEELQRLVLESGGA